MLSLGKGPGGVSSDLPGGLVFLVGVPSQRVLDPLSQPVPHLRAAGSGCGVYGPMPGGFRVLGFQGLRADALNPKGLGCRVISSPQSLGTCYGNTMTGSASP